MDVGRRLESAYDEVDAERLRLARDRALLRDAADPSSAASRIDDVEFQPEQDDLGEKDAFMDILSVATREQAHRACELWDYFGRPIDTLVLDIDETLRSATHNGNRISPQACALVREFHDRGGAIVVCTGKSIGYVRGCLTQAVGQGVLTSGRFSIVYEAGAGVYTPNAGSATKQRLYDRIDDSVREVFERVKAEYLERIPDDLRDRHHFEQKEFNVTLIPNADVKSDVAIETIDQASQHLVATVATIVAARTSHSPRQVIEYFALADPELASALDYENAALEGGDEANQPAGFADGADVDDLDLDPLVRSIDIGYYRGDAVEVTSGTLGKGNGVQVATETLSLEDPFMLAMGDSKTDLEIMEAITDRNRGICAAPDHASEAVLDQCERANGLVFEQGRVEEALRIVLAYNCLDRL